jgi:hypothetical protein
MEGLAVVDFFHFPAPQNGVSAPFTHYELPASVQLSDSDIEALKNRQGLENNWKLLFEVASQFTLGLMLVFQSQDPFDLHSSDPFIAVVGDDLFCSLGPDGFDEDSIRTLLASASYIGIITCDPIVSVYAEAATIAAKHRKNAVVIETNSDHGRTWCQLARAINPNVPCRIAIAEGERSDGYA